VIRGPASIPVLTQKTSDCAGKLNLAADCLMMVGMHRPAASLEHALGRASQLAQTSGV